jgi:hypothetical protein
MMVFFLTSSPHRKTPCRSHREKIHLCLVSFPHHNGHPSAGTSKVDDLRRVNDALDVVAQTAMTMSNLDFWREHGGAVFSDGKPYYPHDSVLVKWYNGRCRCW